MISVFDLFSVGIGPSSSHTVGPMRAARTFVGGLKADGLLSDTARVQAELFGSLGATGHGHGSGPAVLLGLAGESPETVDTDTVGPRVERIRTERRINILDAHEIDFDPDRDLTLHRRRSLPYHPNGMTFAAYDGAGAELRSRTYYSVGGGFVVDEAAAGADRIKPDSTVVRYPFLTGAQLLDVTTRTGLSISEVMLANERSWRSEADIRAGLLEIWRVMQECVQRGCERDGVLPGGLKVRRRAAELRRGLEAEAGTADPLHAMDWVTLFALAVNEENAAGGRVVTAPTNGAAGIIPAVLHYYTRFVPDADDEGVVRFLLTAGAIGVLFKENASISGAEVGCQGEVGSACSMAAAGLAEALGGTPEQVENAAEIGMEHNLGLTCDPVGGLVQIPCIERNAVASIKAITAARLALRGDGVHKVSLDKVIKTMRETGADMKVKYKETARGGLAVNVIEC
ncbi:L-serine ammonia-lyase [Micromonospora saelicesensis]|uniref:L-serine dehydratase n=1 Tax=Micromonospora saelicesensis TaxID=285676 RepID=A0A1C4UN22_9ACTN|nr:L-serine ammonia-lyase [Micromonospora saelicesensis]RAO29806.1 L-serine ammonia-lyase [Micromonospora saelicesensis]RAO51070.1 L-serine ammonia-lyase [Micromonospora saelicesensis]SCE73099.1 L-serine dehydratase [Micromonospora saelicesensis]